MPSIISHAFVAVVAAQPMRTPRTPVRLWALAAACAMLPDADVVSFYIGVPRDSIFAHRGITHSLPFAVLVGFLLGQAAFRGAKWDRERARFTIYLMLAMASHGVLDAFTAGGNGVAFFAPFSAARFAAPWRPILVSPIGVMAFLSERGVMVLMNELVWLWMPSLAIVAAAALGRKAFGSQSDGA